MASTFTQLVKIFTHRVCVRLASFHHRSPVAVETEISQKTRGRLLHDVVTAAYLETTKIL